MEHSIQNPVWQFFTRVASYLGDGRYLFYCQVCQRDIELGLFGIEARLLDHLRNEHPLQYRIALNPNEE